jgi:hypothetical protein
MRRALLARRRGRRGWQRRAGDDRVGEQLKKPLANQLRHAGSKRKYAVNNQKVSIVIRDACSKRKETGLSNFCFVAGYAGIVVVLLALLPVTFFEFCLGETEPGPLVFTLHHLASFAYLYICNVFGRALYFLIPFNVMLWYGVFSRCMVLKCSIWSERFWR